jgi:flavin reductase (DIM6/NTAB) family NADH-FMN oxidoreductase RutF
MIRDAEALDTTPPSAADFRACVGEFATGVTVVTANASDGPPAGMTLNSFTSVSLEPLLVLVSLAHGARTLSAVRSADAFAISVLHRWQREVAIRFARRGDNFPAHLAEERDGFLFVPGALAHMACRVHQIVPSGDHDLVVGRVVSLRHDAGEPLVFHRGRLGGLAIDAHVATGSLGGWGLED